MKKTLILCHALCALTATVASGAGINLSWNDCGGFGAVNATFACNTNTGAPFIAVASWVSPGPTAQLVAIDCVIDLHSAAATMPLWWSSNCPPPPAANARLMTADADFLAGPFNCVDPWAGAASGGVAGYGVGFGGPSRARMIISESVDFSTPVATDGTSEYYAFRLFVPRGASAGSTPCAGCNDRVCLMLNTIKEGLQDGSTRDINTPLTRNHITWQGGSVADCIPVPVRNSTWGQVKSLYR